MSLRLPEDLWERVERTRGDVKRETWVREAVRQRVDRDGGARGALRRLMRSPDPVPPTHHMAGAARREDPLGPEVER